MCAKARQWTLGLILVGGGLLLIAVIGHGFWLAWRSRRDTLKIDIDPNIPRGDFDDLDLLRAELPNGGARVRTFESARADRLRIGTARRGCRADQAGAHGRKPIVAQRKTQPHREPAVQKEAKARPIVPERPRDRSREAARPAPQPIQTRPSEKQAEVEPPAEPLASRSIPPEVIVINVLARNGAKFGGTDLLEAFLRNGLKFGDMNIFHRIQPASKEVQFSVASAVEPGTFDLSAMEAFKTPGVSFFMRMPGRPAARSVRRHARRDARRGGLVRRRERRAVVGDDEPDDPALSRAHRRLLRKRMSQRALIPAAPQ
jgi:cell division protein ZipA